MRVIGLLKLYCYHRDKSIWGYFMVIRVTWVISVVMVIRVIRVVSGIRIIMITCFIFMRLGSLRSLGLD